MAPSGEERGYRPKHGRGGGHGRGGFGRGASRSFGGRRDGGWGGRKAEDRGKRKTPNVFIAAKVREKEIKPGYRTLFQIDNPGIREAVKEVQDACILENPGLEAHSKNAPIQKTHVTVLVAHVTEPQLETAKAIVDEVLQKKILPQLPEKQFKISFEGTSSFGEKVVYAEVGEGAKELLAMNEALLEAFERAGFDCDSRYTPHMTVMKVAINQHIFSSESSQTRYSRVGTQTVEFHANLSPDSVTKFSGNSLSAGSSCSR